MISGFNIQESEWKNTPQSVRIAAVSLQHQLFILNARFLAHQQQLHFSQSEIAKLERTSHEQTAETERLQSQVARLTESLGLNSSNSSLPPSSDSPFRKRANNRHPSGLKQGAQPGHEGVGRWLLNLDEIDEVIELRPKSCMRCGGLKFEPADWFLPARRQVTEITAAGTKTTEYQRPALKCSRCGRRNRAAWISEASAGAFGSRVKAVIAYLTGRLGASHRDTVDALQELFGIKIGLGSISAMQRRISQVLARPVAQLEVLVNDQAVVYVDETGWLEKDKQKWLWVAASQAATVFQVMSGRSTKDAQSMIGENRTGIITTDRYGGYNFLSGDRRQICWAHLKRDFQRIAERGGHSNLIGAELLEQTNELFELWHLVRDGTLKKLDLQTTLEPIKRKVKNLLTEGTMAEHSKTKNTCRNILKLWDSLWTFTQIEGVEPTNNQAERALRRAVLWRRKSFGTQSAAGSLFVARILTVVATLKQQGRGVLDYLEKSEITTKIRIINEISLTSIESGKQSLVSAH